MRFSAVMLPYAVFAALFFVLFDAARDVEHIYNVSVTLTEHA